MSKIEMLERRIKTYQQELRKLRLQLKIAKIDQAAIAARNQWQRTNDQEGRRG